MSSTDSFTELKRVTLNRRVGFDGTTEVNQVRLEEQEKIVLPALDPIN